MAFPEFEYFQPTTAEEAVALLLRYGPGAKLLAGGQTLVPLLNMRLVRPDAVVDLGGIPALRGIAPSDGGAHVGAMTRHREVETSPLLAERCPILSAAAARIGHSHIRNRGTIGGSIAHADPAAEYPVALVALEATIEMLGPSGARSLPAEEFFLGPLLTAMAPDELITGVRVPPVPADTGWAFEELTLRSGDFALVCVAALLTIRDGRVHQARIAVGGAGPRATRLPGAEAALVGQVPGPGAWQQAGAVAAREVEAVGDVSASAHYRREVTAVYVEESLAAAARRREG